MWRPAAGVHPATASRALNPGTRLLVSEDTARRVTEAAERLGYRPNPVAGRLRTRRSHTVGVLIPDLNNPLFPPIVRGLEDRLAEHGYVALIGNTDADAGARTAGLRPDAGPACRRLRARRRRRCTARHPAEAAAADVPVVLMNRTAPDYPLLLGVGRQRAGRSRAAVAHLAGLGHTRIGHIAGPQDVSTAIDRLRGFRAAWPPHHLPVTDDQIVYAGAYSIEEGTRRGRELLAAGGDLTAVVAANDMLAVGCYGALDELGLRCPEEISVTGFNDMPFVDRLHPSLTSVRFPHYQLGTEAATLLIERIGAADRPVEARFLAPELIARGSSGRPAPGPARGAAGRAAPATPTTRL